MYLPHLPYPYHFTIHNLHLSLCLTSHSSRSPLEDSNHPVLRLFSSACYPISIWCQTWELVSSLFTYALHSNGTEPPPPSLSPPLLFVFSDLPRFYLPSIVLCSPPSPLCVHPHGILLFHVAFLPWLATCLLCVCTQTC